MFPQYIKLVLSCEHITTTVLIILFWVINLTAHLPHQILSVLWAKKVFPLLSSFLLFFFFTLSLPSYSPATISQFLTQSEVSVNVW